MKSILPAKLTVFLILAYLLGVTPNLFALTILYIPGKNSSFYKSVERGIQNRAQTFNSEVIIPGYPESWNPDEQEELLQRGLEMARPDLVIIVPASPLLRAPLELLHKKNIPIITLDRRLDSISTSSNDTGFPLVHISTDQHAGGAAMATGLAQLINNKGKIYINSTFPDFPVLSDRFRAFLNAISQYPNITITGIDIAGIDFSNIDRGIGGSSREIEMNAYHQSLEFLQKHPDINAIFCTNELSGKGIARAIDEIGLSGSIKIGVWDATSEMVQTLNNGLIDLLLAQKPFEMGTAAVYWGIRHIDTQETPPKAVYVGFEKIDKQNIRKSRIQNLIYH